MRNRLVMIAMAVAACAGSSHQRNYDPDQSFDCKERLASYLASRDFSGDEVGVQLDCQQAGPRIKRWKTNKVGKHYEDSRVLAPSEFDEVWRALEGVGWRYLKDCTNGSHDKKDPVYVFDIRDDSSKVSFQCQARTMPYPYNQVLDPLMMAAARGRPQLGDDEPVELRDDAKKKPK